MTMNERKTCSTLSNPLILLLLSFVIVFFNGTQLISSASSAANPVNAKTAMDLAMRSGKFISLIFYEKKDPAYHTMSTCIDNFAKSSQGKLIVHQSRVSDPREKEIVDRFDIRRARLPVILIIAPNGAVTAGYEQKVTLDQVKKSVEVPELMLKVLKPLQERKITLVLLQNEKTKFNKESSKAINDFIRDPKYKKVVSTINANPSASGSREFLRQCSLATPQTEAVVVVMLPPKTIAKVLKGKITKADVEASLQTCTPGSGCCPGR
ncbi:MAG: hypothetical protein ACM3SY_18700 [Candidatus Omnitrophota bacterium]